MSAVVVRARFDSATLDVLDLWRFKKGDLGVLKWKSHRRHPRFLEPRVIWDNDPQRKARRISCHPSPLRASRTRPTE